MRFRTHPGLLLACLWSALCLGPSASADVVAGDVIDETNWEKIEGMVPEPVLNYVKKGDLTIRVDDLAFDPREYMSPYDKQHLESNKGKYDLNEEGVIIEVQSGRPPDFIEGIPFPEIDLNDPKAAPKIVFNNYYHGFTQGNLDWPTTIRWVGRGGQERSIEMSFKQFPMDGLPSRKEDTNKQNVERYTIIQITEPFDIAGTNILLWRYRDARPDSTFAYIPAIRRIRRMSPANRSDSYVGSDLCVDDAWVFDGKVTSFAWKLLGKQEGLLPYVYKTVQPLSNVGEVWTTTERTARLEMNYETKGAQNAPWFPSEETALVWVKRPVYVLELTAKDPYYNYGKQQLWVDAGNNHVAVFKVIYDRAGAYWKNVWLLFGGFANEDKSMTLMVPNCEVAIDDRSDHASVINGFGEGRRPFRFYDTVQKEGDYSLAGFQGLAK
jgi:Protein of unknown function (DUF1329)